MKKILGVVAGLGLLLSSSAFATVLTVSNEDFDNWELLSNVAGAGGTAYGTFDSFGLGATYDPTNELGEFSINFTGDPSYTTLGDVNVGGSYTGVYLNLHNSSYVDLTANLYVVSGGTKYYAEAGAPLPGVTLAMDTGYRFDWDFGSTMAITEVGLYLSIPNADRNLHGSIPEPASLLLMGIGLLGLGAAKGRKLKA